MVTDVSLLHQLPEDEPQAVQIMVNWMYQNEICIPQRTLAFAYHLQGSLLKSSSADLFVKLYVLGQKYQMPTLRNDALDAIKVYMSDGGKLSVEALTHAWDNTPTKSPLRLLLLKVVKSYVTASALEDLRGDLSSLDFCIDIAIELLANYDQSMVTNILFLDEEWRDDFCSLFHSHEEDFFFL